MGKILWGYLPSASELGTRMLEEYATEAGYKGRVRKPVLLKILAELVPELRLGFYCSFVHRARARLRQLCRIEDSKRSRSARAASVYFAPCHSKYGPSGRWGVEFVAKKREGLYLHGTVPLHTVSSAARRR
ncbi:hypothetical protein NDU88_003792 [Pleurodeles waltl]|uniref:Uncharacterized protein n=1 Tax=Pleurodeles waltl TaxID=8319 RepID=A0AAV7PJ74_PLEWA|nr:hypothetical protein NDU88_003792 [Pleurodeles waltl]